MIYTCDECKFIFSRAGAVEACPRCDSSSIREATEAEKGEYDKIRGGIQNSTTSEERALSDVI